MQPRNEKIQWKIEFKIIYAHPTLPHRPLATIYLQYPSSSPLIVSNTFIILHRHHLLSHANLFLHVDKNFKQKSTTDSILQIREIFSFMNNANNICTIKFIKYLPISKSNLARWMLPWFQPLIDKVMVDCRSLREINSMSMVSTHNNKY